MKEGVLVSIALIVAAFAAGLLLGNFHPSSGSICLDGETNIECAREWQALAAGLLGLGGGLIAFWGIRQTIAVTERVSQDNKRAILGHANSDIIKDCIDAKKHLNSIISYMRLISREENIPQSWIDELAYPDYYEWGMNEGSIFIIDQIPEIDIIFAAYCTNSKTTYMVIAKEETDKKVVSRSIERNIKRAEILSNVLAVVEIELIRGAHRLEARRIWLERLAKNELLEEQFTAAIQASVDPISAERPIEDSAA